MDMHTVLNILNIIVGELHLIQMDLRNPTLLQPVIDRTIRLKAFLNHADNDEFTSGVVNQLESALFEKLEQAEKEQPDLLSNEEYLEYKSTFREIFDVFETRLDELLTRWMVPDRWERYTVEDFKKDTKKFFSAVEKHAKGRYRIIYPPESQKNSDYLVTFYITSDRDDNLILFPLIFKDVMRDIIANARKYTAPGGTIDIHLAVQNNELHFKVADTGIGIPRKELSKVFEYGRRASNVQNRRSMGGGIGLTKAYVVTQRFGGEIWISSTEGKGTEVKIIIPIPEEEWDD